MGGNWWWQGWDDDRIMMTGWWRWWWPGGDICQLFITTLTLADSGVRSVSQSARRLICAMMMSGLGYDRNTLSWSCLIYYICEKLQAGRSWLELVQYHPGWCWYRVVRKLLCKAPWVQIGWNYHGMCTVHFAHIIQIYGFLIQEISTNIHQK